MKKIFLNNRLIAIAFITLFSIGTVTSVMASNYDFEVPVVLKYIGHVKNQPMFELKFYGNAEQNSFTIFVKDEYGNVLYRENIKGETFSKKFTFIEEELGDIRLNFEVFCNNTKKSAYFEVNRNDQIVKDYSVAIIK